MSTSKLQREVSRLLSIYLGGYTIRENTRPDWLTCDGERLELDFYLEELDVAIEVQGEQHYRFVEMFHGDADGFSRQLKRDKAKRSTCERRGTCLFEVLSIDDAIEAINAISKSNGQKSKRELKRKQAKKKKLLASIIEHDKEVEFIHTALKDVEKKREKARDFMRNSRGTSKQDTRNRKDANDRIVMFNIAHTALLDRLSERICEIIRETA